MVLTVLLFAMVLRSVAMSAPASSPPRACARPRLKMGMPLKSRPAAARPAASTWLGEAGSRAVVVKEVVVVVVVVGVYVV